MRPLAIGLILWASVHHTAAGPEVVRVVHDVIIKTTGNIRECNRHAGVPLIGTFMFYMAISANIVPLALQVFTG